MGPQFVDHLLFFFFNDTATTEIYTLSLHDALPIARADGRPVAEVDGADAPVRGPGDRKSTRLNSSHTVISYAVFCLKKKKQLRGVLQDENTNTTVAWRRQSDEGVRSWSGNKIFPNLTIVCFFFNDTATTEIYTLSLHDALPI